MLGFAFLYVPILSLIVYSFNKSRLVTVWGGFSTQWYGRLFENEQILERGVAVAEDRGDRLPPAPSILGTLAGPGARALRHVQGPHACSPA